MLKWELVEKDGGILRAKVPAGWLVKTFQIFQIVEIKDLRKTPIPVNGMLSLTFVPDPNHEWTLEEEKEELKKENIFDLPAKPNPNAINDRGY